MRQATPDRSHLREGAGAPKHAPSSSAAPPSRAALSHRQARDRLALLLEETTEPALAERLRQHVAGCARCQQEVEQLRQAEAWFRAQPVEAPQVAAAQGAVWAAIQARIAADSSAPAAETVRANGHAPAARAHSDAARDQLVPLAAEMAGAEGSEADRLYHPLPVPRSSAPVTIFLRSSGKFGILKPRSVLIAALAASFIVGSFAALFLAHLSNNGAVPSGLGSPQLFSMDVLDPGTETPSFSFDPVSRHLIALTGDLRYGCPPGAHCPSLGPTCLQFSMLDVATDKSFRDIRPTCAQSGNTRDGATFLNLLDESARGQALLIGSDQRVQTVDTLSGSIVRSYPLACCSDAYAQPYNTLLDQHNQLLLTPARSGVAGVSDELFAQDVTTGQTKYQAALDTFQFRDALVSNVTGWLYLWSECAVDSNTSCVEIYNAEDGRKVGGWQDNSQETPLAADPTEDVLYVRADHPNGQSETLVVDGRSGQTVGRLPPAQAMAINAPLHHAYLLDDTGVTVVDTRTRRKLSTLPVLAHDESWVAPAVDEATGRVYLPIQRGKLLMAQDDPAGQLRMRSASLEAVLNAERAMTLDEEQGEAALFPWELPIGAETLTAYHPLSQGTPSSCEIGWVAARSTAAITAQGSGQYTVQFSLAWNDQFARVNAGTPPSQSSYPHEHSWLYQVPASGGAQRSSEQGAAFAHC